MKQTTHTWIAVRALGLLANEGSTPGLVSILSLHLQHCHIGCWVPDMSSFKKGHGYTENHTFKIAPFPNDPGARFILEKDELLDHLDPATGLTRYLDEECQLPADWWAKSYKADQPDGRHLPDVLSSLYDTCLDLILMGDQEVDEMTPGTVNFAAYLEDEVAIRKEQISTFFFMLSHYIADCFMPCHCDDRRLAVYGAKFHKQWEEAWDRRVGEYFAKAELAACGDDTETILQEAEQVDQKIGLEFPDTITTNNEDDMWEQAIFWSRGSFALSCGIFPEDEFPFGGDAEPKYGEYFTSPEKDRYDPIVLQSAVCSVASLWKKTWLKFHD